MGKHFACMVIFCMTAAMMQEIMADSTYSLSSNGKLITIQRKVKVRSKIECASECYSDKSCKTFGYCNTTKVCSLSIDEPSAHGEESINCITQAYMSKKTCFSSLMNNSYAGGCLALSSVLETWDEAKVACEVMEARLLVLDSYDSMAWFMDYRKNDTESASIEIWVGAKYYNGMKSYRWINGKETGLEENSAWWYGPEPNNNGLCVSSYSETRNFELRDSGCEFRRKYFCEFYLNDTE